MHLRGMPWKATTRDIVEFFGDLRVAPNGVHIVLNAEGRPSGDGFVEFETHADAVQALQKHPIFNEHRRRRQLLSSQSDLANVSANHPSI